MIWSKTTVWLTSLKLSVSHSFLRFKSPTTCLWILDPPFPGWLCDLEPITEFSQPPFSPLQNRAKNNCFVLRIKPVIHVKHLAVLGREQALINKSWLLLHAVQIWKSSQKGKGGHSSLSGWTAGVRRLSAVIKSPWEGSFHRNLTSEKLSES